MSLPGRMPELLNNNKKFSETWKAPPTLAQMRTKMQSGGGGTLVLTCLDPRVVPEQFLGPNLGAGVLRNAGGRATREVVASLTTLRGLANSQYVMVIHHTDCGLTYTTDAQIAKSAKERTPDAAAEIDSMTYGCFTVEDYEAAIKEDVETLRNSPSLKGMEIFGFSMNLETAEVKHVDF